MTLLAIRVPADNEREPDHTEQVLDALHTRMGRHDEVTLSLARVDGCSGLFIRCPEHLETVVKSGLQAFYRDADIETLSEDLLQPRSNHATASLHLHPDLIPLRHYSELSASESSVLVDPLNSGLSALAQTESFGRPLSKNQRRKHNASPRLPLICH